MFFFRYCKWLYVLCRNNKDNFLDLWLILQQELTLNSDPLLLGCLSSRRGLMPVSVWTITRWNFARKQVQDWQYMTLHLHIRLFNATWISDSYGKSSNTNTCSFSFIAVLLLLQSAKRRQIIADSDIVFMAKSSNVWPVAVIHGDVFQILPGLTLFQQ